MPTEADVKEWIELCLSGNAPVSCKCLLAAIKILLAAIKKKAACY